MLILLIFGITRPDQHSHVRTLYHLTFESIVSAYYQPLYRFGYSLAKKRATEAGDLAQQTFLIYARKGGALRESSESSNSWLFHHPFTASSSDASARSRIGSTTTSRAARSGLGGSVGAASGARRWTPTLPSSARRGRRGLPRGAHPLLPQGPRLTRKSPRWPRTYPIRTVQCRASRAAKAQSAMPSNAGRPTPNNSALFRTMTLEEGPKKEQFPPTLPSGPPGRPRGPAHRGKPSRCSIRIPALREWVEAQQAFEPAGWAGRAGKPSRSPPASGPASWPPPASAVPPSPSAGLNPCRRGAAHPPTAPGGPTLVRPSRRPPDARAGLHPGPNSRARRRGRPLPQVATRRPPNLSFFLGQQIEQTAPSGPRQDGPPLRGARPLPTPHNRRRPRSACRAPSITFPSSVAPPSTTNGRKSQHDLLSQRAGLPSHHRCNWYSLDEALPKTPHAIPNGSPGFPPLGSRDGQVFILSTHGRCEQSSTPLICYHKHEFHPRFPQLRGGPRPPAFRRPPRSRQRRLRGL